MTLEELRDETSYLVNFSAGQVDQAFRGPATYPNQRIDSAINEAYKEECSWAKTHSSRLFFRQQQSFTWPASTTSLAIPASFASRDMECVRDDTDVVPGVTLSWWDGLRDGSGLYKIDMKTWGWYPAPSSARTLTIVYIAAPEKLQDAGDVPALLPLDYHYMLPWCAAILLYQKANLEAPQQWITRRDECRFLLWKAIANGGYGQPRLTPGATIVNPFPDIIRSL